MSGSHRCPRRDEIGAGPWAFLPESDAWLADSTCSYCGSLNPDLFMARLEAGDVELGPTDKSYKVYVESRGGETFKQTYRDCPRDSRCSGPDDCPHWVTRETGRTKLYFQHLSTEQRRRFIELLNDRKLIIGMPGYFYVHPFFAKRA